MIGELDKDGDGEINYRYAITNLILNNLLSLYSSLFFSFLFSIQFNSIHQHLFLPRIITLERTKQLIRRGIHRKPKLINGMLKHKQKIN